MQANVGRVDGCIRGCLAVAFLITAVVFNEQLLISLAAAFAALLFAATALTHHCPLYDLQRLSTRADQSHPQQ